MSKKTKAQLEEELISLRYDNEFLEKRVLELTNSLSNKIANKAPEIPTTKKIKYDRHWTLSFELNPTKWFRLYSYRYDWKRHAPTSPTREGQIEFGPVSFSWYRDRV